MRNLEEALFWEVFFGREALRSDLARTFDVSAATVSRSAGLLLARQMIVEKGVSLPYRGRRPSLLQINPDLARVAGVEIDRDRATAVVADMAGTLLGRGAIPIGPENSIACVLTACQRALAVALVDAGLAASELARIGVGHTGTLDVEKGICLEWQGVPHWCNVSLRDELQQIFQIPVTLDDRARAVGLALHLLDAENRCHRSAIYVQIGTGIGGCIFVDGRMLRGSTLSGGEIGHMVIDRDGPLCSCGSYGCVEAYASLPATLRRVTRALAEGAKSCLRDLPASEIDAQALTSAAIYGDELARACLSETAQALGIGIANAVQLLNPSLVVLAGKFAHISRDFLLSEIQERVLKQCFETVSRSLAVRVAPIRKDLAALGCALLATTDVAAELLQRVLFLPLTEPVTGI